MCCQCIWGSLKVFFSAALLSVTVALDTLYCDDVGIVLVDHRIRAGHSCSSVKCSRH